LTLRGDRSGIRKKEAHREECLCHEGAKLERRRGMVGVILAVSLGHAIGAVVAAAVVAWALGYAFRGKERRALSSLGNDIEKKL
jgi:hypothetical protein